MKNILAFGASSSRHSINRQFAAFAAQQIPEAMVDLLDLNDYEMPIYSIDREKETGIPELAKEFKQKILDTDGIIISFAEHNGAYSAAFKNIFDWISRIDGNVWAEKPMLLLSTSPGGRGGKTVLDIAVAKFSRMNPKVTGSFSLPSFKKNFSGESGILDIPLREDFNQKLKAFVSAISTPSEV
ncbi:MAG: NAD(P)H-dependent oxidoreductase [Saprospiraceae bacterium]|nr:NAD(P)H-dependent oxidoreductase [Saprospiraceae bacterium]